MGSRIMRKKMVTARTRKTKVPKSKINYTLQRKWRDFSDGRSKYYDRKTTEKSESEASYDIRSRVFRYRSDICEPATTLIFDCLDKEGKSSPYRRCVQAQIA